MIIVYNKFTNEITHGFYRQKCSSQVYLFSLNNGFDITLIHQFIMYSKKCKMLLAKITITSHPSPLPHPLLLDEGNDQSLKSMLAT